MILSKIFLVIALISCTAQAMESKFPEDTKGIKYSFVLPSGCGEFEGTLGDLRKKIESTAASIKELDAEIQADLIFRKEYPTLHSIKSFLSNFLEPPQ
jgi:hypothetical protein